VGGHPLRSGETALRKIVVVVLALLSSLLVIAQPAGAGEPGRERQPDLRERGVTLGRPVVASHGQLQLSGRVAGSTGHVVLQRNADGLWVKARRVNVHEHTYEVTVPARPREQRFRVRSGDLTSQIRIVAPSQPTEKQDACGKRPRKADGSRWSCTFVDDFAAVRLDRSRWVPHTDLISGPLNGAFACYRDHSDNIEVARGTLRLTVRKLDHSLPCSNSTRSSPYTAGMVTTYRRFSQRYGRFETRFMVTATEARGLQEAFWMWPDDRQDIPEPWPAAGEIDVVETYSGNPDLAIPFLHYTWNDNGGPRNGLNTAWDCESHRGVFNTYTLEWSSDRLEIFVNGKSCLVNTSGNKAFQRKYILALTQALGTGTNRYDGEAPLPATMTVDYVRVWS
jgi:beta-glucanase (GH16 family)